MSIRATSYVPSAATAGRLRIGVMGPLAVGRDGEIIDHADLRRQRVRELLSYLVARRRVRREEVVDALWPHLRDGALNLRVTLSYLQRVLEPERRPGQRPHFVRADSIWLELAEDNHLTVDVWDLNTALDRADHAHRSGAPTAFDLDWRAIERWQGEPFADVPYAQWASAPRERLRTRFTAAALRVAELSLAVGRALDARHAAQVAVDADPWCEPAYQVLARGHLHDGDAIGARRVLDACRHAVDELDPQLQPATTGGR